MEGKFRSYPGCASDVPWRLPQKSPGATFTDLVSSLSGRTERKAERSVS
jgi:hypothetical protein